MVRSIAQALGSPQDSDTQDQLAKFLSRDILGSISNQSDLFIQLHIEHCAAEIRRMAHIHLDEYIDQALYEEAPIFWLNLPYFLKNRIYCKAHRQLPGVLENLLEDIEAEI